jgi:peptidoglycan/xylan/chitin deacetylase (PgdA/CDA1 family)
MDIRGFFNILLLSLSLATILITLTSYIIFRIRNTFANKQVEDLHKLKGVFFDRYAPHLQKINNENRKKKTVKVPEQKVFRYKIASVFGLIVVSLITVLLLEDKFSYRIALQKQVQEHDKLRELIDKGLLKKYDLNEVLPNPNKDEYIGEARKRRQEEIFNVIREKSFALITTRRNRTYNPKAHNLAIKAWKDFFKRKNLKFRLYEGLANIPQDAVIVLPQLKSLSDGQRNQIKDFFGKGRQVIVTGAFGTLNGIGDPSKSENLLKDHFNLTSLLLAQTDNYQVSLFKSDIAPFWHIPPGRGIHWAPLELGEIYIDKENEGQIVWGTSINRPVTFESGNLYRTNYKLYEENGVRRIWSGLDPIITKETIALEKGQDRSIRPFERFYSDEVFGTSFMWLLNKPIAKISNWPKAKQAAGILSVDAEHHYENAEDLYEIFESNDIPSTFFVVSDFYMNNTSVLRDIDHDAYEIASHSENHNPFEDLTLAESFSRLSKTRIDIEEVYERPVLGFRPPFEKYDDITLNGIVQNKYTYFFGDSQILGFYPITIADGNLIFYPRTLNDDFHIDNDPYIVGQDRVVQTMVDDLKISTEFGGGYFFNIHTHVFGKELYREKIKDFIKEIPRDKVWMTNFKEMTRFIQNKQQYYANVIEQDDLIIVTVKNTAKEKQLIENLHVHVQLDKQRKYKIIKNDENEASLKEVAPGAYVVNFKTVEDSKAISLELVQ